MFRRLFALFDRYAAVRLDVTRPGFPLLDETGRVIGNIDRVQLAGHRFRVEGWALATRVELRGAGYRASTRPTLRRSDVALGLGNDPDHQLAAPSEDVGFVLEIPRPPKLPNRPPVLTLSGTPGPAGTGPSAEPELYALPLPTALAPSLALLPGFAWRLARVAPLALRYRRLRDPADRARIRTLMALAPPARGGRLDPRALRDEGSPAEATGAGPGTGPETGPAITVVLPVYNAFELLQDCLGRLAAHTDLPWHLVAVEDASPDERVRPWLRDWAAEQGADRVTLLENAENLGFIGAVNRGLEAAAARGDHVVLLNSDALVPAGWASRLLAPIAADAGVATVTPMSNDAEIFSAPLLCERVPLLPGMADAIDRAARDRLAPGLVATAPTGVGFCMAMNADYLAREPRLDTAFGKGYGEEVDWCQRVAARGGRHLGLAGLYVEHRGGESFGSETKRALLKTNGAIITRRYPDYDERVRAFIAADPLLTPRLVLALAWAGAWAEATEDAVPVYVGHTLGGGAAAYLERRVAAERAAGRPAVVLRLGGSARWQVELEGPAGRLTGHTDEADLLVRLLGALGPRRRLVYSCAVGDADPVGLPEVLTALAGDGPVEVLFHDFFPLNPSYTLLDRQGRYHGPGAVLEEIGPPLSRPDRTPVDLAAWRAAWGPFLARAERLVVFSEDSGIHVRTAWPDLAPRIEVRPHTLLTEVPRIDPVSGKNGPKRRLASLGNIGQQKGAEVLGPLAHALEEEGTATLMVLGNVDPAYPLPAGVRVHGDYRVEDLPALVARYGITDWLIPSVWPETFSYTTHEALATGMPVYAFGIGAQGEAVAKAANGHAVPFGDGEPQTLARAMARAVGGVMEGAVRDAG